MIDANWMTCQELVEVITAYWDGALPAPYRERFQAHLAICAECRDYLAQVDTTVRALRHLCDDGPDTHQRDHLLGLFREWKSE